MYSVVIAQSVKPIPQNDARNDLKLIFREILDRRRQEAKAQNPQCKFSNNSIWTWTFSKDCEINSFPYPPRNDTGMPRSIEKWPKDIIKYLRQNLRNLVDAGKIDAFVITRDQSGPASARLETQHGDAIDSSQSQDNDALAANHNSECESLPYWYEDAHGADSRDGTPDLVNQSPPQDESRMEINQAEAYRSPLKEDGMLHELLVTKDHASALNVQIDAMKDNEREIRSRIHDILDLLKSPVTHSELHTQGHTAEPSMTFESFALRQRQIEDFLRGQKRSSITFSSTCEALDISEASISSMTGGVRK
ncbi:hypothetical protein PVAG01_09392 [Phlyctema vagabunda]|uniref:Uncharacterized protein n=1 Tax=Phlyctema vagabunda TaxID=108571 RepID=A0ABR4P799_9HELO